MVQASISGPWGEWGLLLYDTYATYHRGINVNVCFRCILAEMLLRIPFLPGDTDLDQLSKIFQALGTPTDEIWPGHRDLPDYVQFKEFQVRR